jgi:mannose-6-phosphate isomerase
MLYPLTFQPIFKERVWGGRKLETVYSKPLPPNTRIGESWEISDRPEGTSVISNGPLAGRDLRWLMDRHGSEILGKPIEPGTKFPILVKLLDAREDLSLQVHPPSSKAVSMGGEPKTEIWYVAQADKDSRLYAGLRPNVTLQEFERKTHDRTVADCFHSIPLEAGDVMFLPSGRVHALGGGTLVFEIQQNSDTTYRVYDWNRMGLDGKPRELHIPQSLASIDFGDTEPDLVREDFKAFAEGGLIRTLANHEAFIVRQIRVEANAELQWKLGGELIILGVIHGEVLVEGAGEVAAVHPGGFVLIPACLSAAVVRSIGPSEFLWVTLP